MLAVAPLVLMAVVVVAPPAGRAREPRTDVLAPETFDLREPVRLRPLPFGLAVGDSASALPGRQRRPLRRPVPPAPDTVVFDAANGMYHLPSCALVRHCHRECATMPVAEAKKLRGTACRSCRGSSR
jgi:hypothetical protein